MKNAATFFNKIYKLPELLLEINRWRLKSKSIVFTNGVFDILHEGHIASLSQAAAQGDVLIVGLNTDASVKRLKGPSRPINAERSRAALLAALLMTDAVVFFDDDPPLQLIKALMPDGLV